MHSLVGRCARQTATSLYDSTCTLCLPKIAPYRSRNNFAKTVDIEISFGTHKFGTKRREFVNLSRRVSVQCLIKRRIQKLVNNVCLTSHSGKQSNHHYCQYLHAYQTPK